MKPLSGDFCLVFSFLCAFYKMQIWVIIIYGNAQYRALWFRSWKNTTYIELEVKCAVEIFFVLISSPRWMFISLYRRFLFISSHIQYLMSLIIFASIYNIFWFTEYDYIDILLIVLKDINSKSCSYLVIDWISFISVNNHFVF